MTCARPAQLHPQLEPFMKELALPVEGVLEGSALAALTGELAGLLPLHSFAVHDSRHRWWERLVLTDAVEVWLLGWKIGQATGAHDHDGAFGSMTVVHGTVTEDLYDFATAQHTGHRVHSAGTSVSFNPEHAHDIIPMTLATTVHAYSPPLRATRPVIGAPGPRLVPLATAPRRSGPASDSHDSHFLEPRT